MKSRMFRIDVRTALLTISVALWCSFASHAHGRGPDLHLCQIVPGETVAEAVHGRIMETKAAEGRCIYTVALPEGSGSSVFVVYQHEAGEYEDLRAAMEGEVTPVDGLGDDAALSFDQDANRYWLLVVRRKLVTLQVSGADKDLVRQVAEAALPQFSGQ